MNQLRAGAAPTALATLPGGHLRTISDKDCFFMELHDGHPLELPGFRGAMLGKQSSCKTSQMNILSQPKQRFHFPPSYSCWRGSQTHDY